MVAAASVMSNPYYFTFKAGFSCMVNGVEIYKNIKQMKLDFLE